MVCVFYLEGTGNDTIGPRSGANHRVALLRLVAVADVARRKDERWRWLLRDRKKAKKNQTKSQ